MDRVLLPFGGELVRARLIRRSKRFLVEAEDGSGRFTAHTNNTGSMLGLTRPGTEALFSVSGNPARKHARTLELVALDGGPAGSGAAGWVGVNTLTPNRMLRAATAAGGLPGVPGGAQFAAEPAFAHGRLDARISWPGGEILVEAKNVTLVEDGVARFPDAVTERGAKHMRELARLAAEGRRAACFFLVQRPDAGCFGPADFIDPEYAREFWRAVRAGVEIWAFEAQVGPEGAWLSRRLPLVGQGR